MARYLRTYSELSTLKTWEERFNYCRCTSPIGLPTFGGSRHLNQMLYSLPEWNDTCDTVIIRDNGCDLGIEGMPVDSYGTVHHLNPITIEQVINRDPCLFDPNNLIFCSSKTHRLIHFGTGETPNRNPIERKPNDTCPWRISK